MRARSAPWKRGMLQGNDMKDLCNTDIKVIRGDTFELYTGLARGWGDVDADPGAYQGRLSFREMQDDGLPILMMATSPLIKAEDLRFPDMRYILHFTLPPEQTADLPPFSVVAFAELRTLTGSYVRRLFNARVVHGD